MSAIGLTSSMGSGIFLALPTKSFTIPSSLSMYMWQRCFCCVVNTNVSLTMWVEMQRMTAAQDLCTWVNNDIVFQSQFGRTEAGVCGRRGRHALWLVGKGRSPEYVTVTLLCPSWEARTARAMGGRPKPAMLTPVPVSQTYLNSTEASPLQLRF